MGASSSASTALAVRQVQSILSSSTNRETLAIRRQSIPQAFIRIIPNPGSPHQSPSRSSSCISIVFSLSRSGFVLRRVVERQHSLRSLTHRGHGDVPAHLTFLCLQGIQLRKGGMMMGGCPADSAKSHRHQRLLSVADATVFLCFRIGLELEDGF